MKQPRELSISQKAWQARSRKTPVSLYLPEEKRAEFARAAHEAGKTMTAIFELLVDGYLAGNFDINPAEK